MKKNESTSCFLIYLILFAFFCIAFDNNIFAQSFWYQTNGPYGGMVNSFTNDSQNNLYAVCGGELYRFDNNQWSNYLPNAPYALCALLRNNQLMFVGANDGVYRSTNAGINWTHQWYGIPNWQVYSLNVDSLGNIYAANDEGIYRSSNNGDNWLNVLNLQTETLSILVTHNNHLFASALFDGLYKSTDSGIIWFKIAFDDTNVNALTENISHYLYAGTETNIFCSTDSGSTWQNLLFNPSLLCNSLFSTSNNIIYCGTENSGIYLSTNQGFDWIQSNQGLFNLDITSFGNKSPNLIFAGAVGGDGIYYSTNYGNQWEVNNIGLKASYILSIAVKRNDLIFAYDFQKGLYLTTDRGNNWILTSLIDSSSFGSEEDFAHYLAIAPNGDIFTTINGIHLSTDNGTTWAKINNQPIGYSLGIYIAPNNYIYTASIGRIYRSTNYGINFTELTGIANNIDCFNIDLTGNLFAGKSNDGIYYSSDDGNSWHSSNLQTPYTFSITNDRYNNLYAGVYGTGIMKSTNHGINWTFFGAVDEPYHILFNQEGKIFVISLVGLQFSSNNGSSWNLLNTGIEKHGAECIALDSSGYIFLGTYDGGVFRSFESTISVKSISQEFPKSFSLYQNYPNPFNPTTKIKFQIAKLGEVKLKIYDILGRDVATLVNENLSPGTYEVELDATNYSSGIYFYKIIAGNFVEVKKMVLIK